MRKIILQEFITLDGVLQAPGGPEEDASSDFKYGGWVAPYFAEADEAAGEFMKQWMASTDILLGRKTFDIWEPFWPNHAEMWPGINDVTKYVASTSKNKVDVEKSDWKNCVVENNVDNIKRLKAGSGGDIKVHGSGNLAQTLFKHDLIDELCLMIFPLTLGVGKRLFGEGTNPAAFTLTESMITHNGVILTYYKREGEVKTGSIGS